MMREGGHQEQQPEDWPTLVAKVMKLGLEFEGWRPEDIQSIKAPVLVMICHDWGCRCRSLITQRFTF